MQAHKPLAQTREEDDVDSEVQVISTSLQLEHYLPYRFNQLADQISSNLTAIFSSEFGVSLSEWRILALLGQQRTMISTNISQRTKMDKAKVSRAVHKLDKEGFLHRERDEQDHRVSHLSLTQSGVTLYNSIIPKALEWEESMVATLSEEERALLHRLMNKLDSQMKRITLD